MSNRTDKVEQTTVCFVKGIIEEIQREAIRQDRSIAWIVRTAWKLARVKIRKRSRVPSNVPMSRIRSVDRPA